jgi:hypothetical protein
MGMSQVPVSKTQIQVVFSSEDVVLKYRKRANCIKPGVCAGIEWVEEVYLTRVWIGNKPRELAKPVRLGELDRYCRVVEVARDAILTTTMVCTEEFMKLLK